MLCTTSLELLILELHVCSLHNAAFIKKTLSDFFAFLSCDSDGVGIHALSLCFEDSTEMGVEVWGLWRETWSLVGYGANIGRQGAS